MVAGAGPAGKDGPEMDVLGKEGPELIAKLQDKPNNAALVVVQGTDKVVITPLSKFSE